LRGPGAYSLGHINGAVNLPVDALFDIGDRNDLVAPVSAIQEAFRAAGIANADIVALYDDGSLVDAGRAFWVFELYGHEKVLLLDGGFKAWEKRRLPIDDIPVKGTRSNYIPSIQSHRLATKFTTRLAVDNPNVVIVDARSTPEYLGQETHTDHYGRIATAINLPALESQEVRDGTTYMKPLGEIRAMYAAVPPDKKVVTYCTIGSKAALAYFNFRRLGYDVSNYDGSWKEWGADPAMPSERGPAAAASQTSRTSGL